MSIVSKEWLHARAGPSTPPSKAGAGEGTIPDSRYPLHIAWDGILVDDPGLDGTQSHRSDIVGRARDALEGIWKERAHEIEHEAIGLLGVSGLREYFRRPSGFFDDHLKRYSKSRRKAPIYWPLSTASGGYTVWLYYYRLTDDTLYQIVSNYVSPKISQVEDRIAQREAEDSRDNGARRALVPTANRRQALELDEELLELASFYNDPKGAVERALGPR